MTQLKSRRQLIAGLAAGAGVLGLASSAAAQGPRPVHVTAVHGSAVTVEVPTAIASLGHNAWGADMVLNWRKATWFHIAVPTPVIMSGRRAKLLRVWVLFEAKDGTLVNVHVYDGRVKLQEFEQVNVSGDHSLSLDGANVFELSSPRSMAAGVGVSMYFQAPTLIDGNDAPRSRFILCSVGAEFGEE